MTRISVLLLGPPEVRLNGHTFPIQRRATRALLYYLASRGGMVGRDELLTLFWENEPETVARSRLREILSRLREALPEPDILVTSSSLVGLDFQSVSVDQLEFQDLIDKAGRLPWQIPIEQPLPDPVYQLLNRAVALWRSPYFLAGAVLPGTPSLDAWLVQTSQNLEHLREHLLERLSDHARAIGDLEGSLQLARLALVHDGLNEELHYRVMRALVDMGRRSEAREHFSGLEKTLRRELDTGPAPHLIDLYRQIREGNNHHIQPEPPLMWNLHPSVQAPFVGRRPVLEQLFRALNHGGCVFIFGESGQGKTRLLQEFVHQEKSNSRLLLAVCRPAESNLSFQPIIELLRYHIRPDEWLNLPQAWASQLTLLLPELFAMRPDLERPLVEFSPETAPGQARALLLEAIRQVFLLISRDQRLILCLDDAQWSDEATLATVTYLTERPPFHKKALLVVAARSEEKNPSLEAALVSLKQSTRLSLIHLSQLTQEEIAELVRSVFGQSVSASFNQQLAQETGGNPLFILETLRALLECDPRPDLSGPVQLPLSESVQTLIQARLHQLRPAERDILETAAVIGIDFDPVVVGIIGQQPDLEVVRQIEALEKRLLVEPVTRSPQDIRYRFIHSKIREVLLQEINPFRTRLLHGKIAHTLENRLRHQASDQAAVLAQHFEYAGEAATAFNYWILAGRRARQLFSIADAVFAFSRAENLIPLNSGLSDEQIHGLYAEWTEMAFEIDDAGTIERINTDLLKLGQERNSALLIGTALDGLSDACMVTNRFEEGLSKTEQALPYLELGGNLYEHMETYNHRGVFLYMLTRVDEAIESFQDALAVGSASHDWLVIRARANAHFQISIAQILNGWPESGLNHALRSLADCSNQNRAHGQVAALTSMAIARYFLGRLIQAREDSQRGIELAERIHAWRMLGYLHDFRSMIEMDLGDADTALRHAEYSILLGERYGHAEIVAAGYRAMGDIFLGLRAHQRCIEYYQRCYEIGQNSFMGPDGQFHLGFCLAVTGQTEAGREHIEQAIALAHESGLGIVSVAAQLCQSLVYSMVDEHGQAYQMATLVHAESQRRGMLTTLLMAAEALGEAALKAGESTKAMEIFQGIAQESNAQSLRWIEVRAQTRIYQLLKLSGQPGSAPKSRVLHLLEQLAENTSHELIQPSFHEYRQQVLKELG